MRPIQFSLTRWMEENGDFKQRHQKMKQDILAHPDIAAFLQRYPEINDVHIDRRLNRLYEYTTQSIQCDQCRSYPACKNLVKGHSPILSFVQDEIHISYEKCESHLLYEQQEQKDNLVSSLHIPKEILEARMEDIEIDAHRIQAIKKLSRFLDQTQKEMPDRGYYLTGSFGIGKTYLLGAVANRLQEMRISSMLIYMPEFVREMREAIQTNSVQQKIDSYKTADVLMLDDIGAENFSAWFRDEVLGAILQYRMMERLPVFFTSNYTMEQLEVHLAETSKAGVEEVKAGRIMERIKRVSEELVLDGENRREHK